MATAPTKGPRAGFVGDNDRIGDADKQTMLHDAGYLAKRLRQAVRIRQLLAMAIQNVVAAIGHKRYAARSRTQHWFPAKFLKPVLRRLPSERNELRERVTSDGVEGAAGPWP